MQKCALKWGTLLNNGVAKHHLTFSFPQRWRRSQRCWEYPSKHRRDRCKRRALLDYFNHRCFYHHVGQPDTPSDVLGFVFVLHLMFFQQAAGIHIQMLGKAIHCHIQLEGFGKLCWAAFPFAVLVRYNLCHSLQHRVWWLLPKLILCMVKEPYQTLLIFT